jgi:hypothetical protein
MREIPLTQGYVALIDDKDFERVSAHKWTAAVCRRKDGTIWNVYAMRGVQVGGAPYTIRLHRFIMGVNDSMMTVDHIDHDGLNCQRTNLRVATRKQNSANQKKQSGTSSQYKGVYMKRGGKWCAQIGFNKQKKILGIYDNEEDAAAAYNRAAAEIFGEFASLNS